MRFRIVTHHAPYTLQAASLEVAAVAGCLIGEGVYPLEGLGEAAGQDVPSFMFGGYDPWFKDHFGRDYAHTLGHLLDHRAAELVQAIESVQLERCDLGRTPDFCARARHLIAQIRLRNAMPLDAEPAAG